MGPEEAVDNSKGPRRRRWRGIIAFSAVAILIGGYWFRYDLAYRWLGIEHDLRMHTSLGKWIKRTLSRDRDALVLNAQFVSVGRGGGTCIDWQTQALVNAPSFPELEETLESLAVDGSAKLDRRIGANLVLLRRTGDPKYATQMFKLVKEPGDMVVSVGRDALAQEFKLGLMFRGESIRDLLTKPRSVAIPISEDEFEGLTADGTVFNRLFWRKDIRENAASE